MKNISKQKFVMLYTLLYLNHNWKGRNKPLDDYYVKQAALTDFITVEILKTVAQPDFYESRENKSIFSELFHLPQTLAHPKWLAGITEITTLRACIILSNHNVKLVQT